MKLTFPHMENLYIPLQTVFEELGQEVIVPPPITRKTITLGARHSPEFACFPLKVNMGNFIEALEAGAETIIMAGGTGPCRFGYYAEVQREILRDLGYDFEILVVEPPHGSLVGLLVNIKKLANYRSWGEIWRVLKLGWQQVLALDEVHALALKVRPREREKGAVSRAQKKAIEMIAGSRTPEDIAHSREAGLGLVRGVEQRELTRPPLKIGLLGEIYMVLEPYVNLELEKTLGEMGVEVERSIYLSHWIQAHLFPKAYRPPDVEEMKKAASSYLDHFIGGHGLESVGNTILFADKGFDGVVHILPFTCTPEIVAQSILPEISRDRKIPLISFSLDEHSGKAGFVTRLEAFIDLLSQKRAHREPAAR